MRDILKPYELKFSKRKTVKVYIENGALRVLAPHRCPERVIKSTLASFYKKYPDYLQLINDSIPDASSVYLRGAKVALAGAGITDVSYKSLMRLFEGYKPEIIERAAALSKQTGIPVNSVKFGKFRAKWGSMDKRGNMKLNNLIFMLSPPLCDYIILHELCHVLHFDHSPRFWAALKIFLPDCRELSRELKKYAFLIRVYC